MRTILRRSIAAVLLGLLTTVLVAWASAWLNRLDRWNETASGVTSRESDAWQVTAYREIGSRLFVGHAPAEVSEPLPQNVVSSLPRQLTTPRGARETRFVRDSGWPFLALRCQAIGDGMFRPADDVEQGIRLPADLSMSAADYNFIALPLRPLVAGFALDVLVFGGVWFGLLALRGFLRGRPRLVNRRFVATSFAAALFGGIVTTWGVAWLCALNVGEFNDPDSTESGWDHHGFGSVARWSVDSGCVAGAARVTSEFAHFDGYLGTPRLGNSDDLMPDWATWARPPSTWLELNENGEYLIDPIDLGEKFIRDVDARGWPLLALRSRIEDASGLEPGGRTNPRPAFALGGVVIERYRDDGSIDWTATRRLPLQPIWPGFLIDTLFYTSVWCVFFAALIGPAPFQRAWRHHRGRCPMCAYDLRHDLDSGCPECGWRR